MELTTLWSIFFCSWVLLRFWLLPLVKDRWTGSNMRMRLARAGTLASMDKAFDMTLVGLVTLTLVISIVEFSALFLAKTSTSSRWLLNAVASLYHASKNIRDDYGTALTVIGVVGAGYSLMRCYSSAKRQVRQLWDVKTREMFARYKADPELVENARNNDELRPFVEKIDLLMKEYASGIEEKGITRDDIEKKGVVFQLRLSHAMSALAMETARKELDVEGAFDIKQKPHPTASSKWWQALRVLTSERLGTDLGLVSKPLSYAATGLLLISLIGWTANPLAESLRLAVNNLRVNITAAQAKRDLTEAVTHIPQDTYLTRDTSDPVRTTQAAHLIARFSLQEMIRSPLLSGTDHARAMRENEADLVREAILDNVPGLSSESRDLAVISDLQKKVVDSFGKAPPLNRREKNAEQVLANDLTPTLQAVEKKDHRIIDRIIAVLSARYSTPPNPLSAQDVLVENIVDGAFSPIEFDRTNQVEDKAQTLIDSFGKEAIKTYAKSYVRKVATQALLDDTRPETWATIKDDVHFDSGADVSQFLDQLYKPGTRRTLAGDIELSMNQQVANSFIPKGQDSASLSEGDQNFLKSVSGYDTIFPSGSTDEASNDAAMASAKVFELASASFKARGVIIGRDPTTTSAIDLTDIRWSIIPSSHSWPTKIALEVRSGDKWRRIGTFDAGVINQALRYAADGRVVATTITMGDGDAIGRLTYLHPALIDTPLGCRIVESDRIVDSFTFHGGSYPVPEDLDSIVKERAEVIRWLRNVDLAETAVMDSSGSTCPMDTLVRNIQRFPLDDVGNAGSLSPSIEHGINDFLDKEEKNLAGSTQFLRAATSCSNGPQDRLADCICNQVVPRGLPIRYWFPEDHTSQFRESAWSQTNDLKWMQSSDDHLGNVELMIHTTFSLRSRDNHSSDEASAKAVDFPDEDLTLLRRVVKLRLPGYVKLEERETSYRDFMEPIEEFILLERFARSALTGTLGQDFPVRRLAELAHITRPYVPMQRTIRWEPPDVDDPEAEFESHVRLAKRLRTVDQRADDAFEDYFNEEVVRAGEQLPVCAQVSK